MIYMNKTTLLKLSAMVLSLGLVTGCATSERLSKMEADIAKAQETANAAMEAANAAQASADECNERCGRIAEKAMAK
jgi:outer membrane murein-binding lipoprotein Lpp